MIRHLGVRHISGAQRRHVALSAIRPVAVMLGAEGGAMARQTLAPVVGDTMLLRRGLVGIVATRA